MQILKCCQLNHLKAPNRKKTNQTPRIHIIHKAQSPNKIHIVRVSQCKSVYVSAKKNNPKQNQTKKTPVNKQNIAKYKTFAN